MFFSRQIWVRVFRLKTRAPNWPARRPKTRLLLERLEDRMLLSSTILQETQGDLAQSVYGVTGKGVAIAILDRVLALK